MKMKKQVLVFGGSGFLGSYFCKLNGKFFEIISPSHSEVDVLNYNQINKYIKKSDAPVIVNFVALADVDKSEKEKGDRSGNAYKLNAKVVKYLSDICKKTGKHLIQISTDCVFNGGRNNRPYNEGDRPNPVNWYGATKYLGENFLKKSGCSYCIARVEMAYTGDLSFKEKGDFVRFFLTQLLAGHRVKAIENQKITPTHINDIAAALRQLIKSQAKGVFHIASTDSISPFEFAVSLANEFGLDPKLVQLVKFGSLKNRSPRPRNPWLDVTKFQTNYGSGILHSNRESIKLLKKHFKLLND